MRAPGFYFRPPGLASFLLLPFAMLYGAVATWRMRQPGERAGVPVICIGNPTLGGAGKTPSVIAIVRHLQMWAMEPETFKMPIWPPTAPLEKVTS